MIGVLKKWKDGEVILTIWEFPSLSLQFGNRLIAGGLDVHENPGILAF